MIDAGHPEEKSNLRELRKRRDDLFFSTTANMLFALEGERWIPLGHVVPVDKPALNRPVYPRWEGNLPPGL